MNRDDYELEAIPGTLADVGLDGLADWIDREAVRVGHFDPVVFGEKVQGYLSGTYATVSLANMVLWWAYDRAIVKAEEARINPQTDALALTYDIEEIIRPDVNMPKVQVLEELREMIKTYMPLEG